MRSKTRGTTQQGQGKRSNTKRRKLDSSDPKKFWVFGRPKLKAELHTLSKEIRDVGNGIKTD